jgi:putative hydrolase of the HAD superfamily
MRIAYARKKALSATPGRTDALDSAVRASRGLLRPEMTDGGHLCRQLVLASGGRVDERLALNFLAELHRQFKEFTIVAWDLPGSVDSTDLSVAASSPLGPGSAMKGREPDLKTLLECVEAGRNVVIHGAPGLGKTTLLQALNARCPGAAFVRLEQGGNPMRDLRLGLHRVTKGDFLPDDDQGIAAIAQAFPDGGVILVDNVDEQDSAEAVQRLVSHLPSLVVAVTSRGQPFPGFVVHDLQPLEPGAAEEILDEEFDLSPDEHRVALERGSGNPQLIKQEAEALEGGEPQADDRLAAMLSRFSGEERRVLWLIGELPAATLPTSLMTEVGRMGAAELRVLRRNAVATPIGDGYELHQTLRSACREIVEVVPQDEMQGLLKETAGFYLSRLAEKTDLEAIDDALPNLMHLLQCLRDPGLKVDLALALIGDRLDDPAGYLPSRGLTGLVCEEELRSLLLEAAAQVGGVKAGRLEKNLGVFCHRADHAAAKGLVLSARRRFQEAGDDEGRAGATWVLGIIADDSCRYEEAEALYREPLDWLRDDEIRAVGQQLVGCSLYHQGRYGEARATFEQARRATEDPVLLSRIERRLAYIELIDGDPERAIEDLQTARDRSAALQRPRDVGRICRHIGEANLRLQRLDDADANLKAARDIFRKVGDRRGLGATLFGLAATRRLQGNLGEAREMARESREIATGGGADLTAAVVSPVGFARAVEEEGRIASAAGEAELAVRKLRRACNIYEVIGYARSEALVRELGAERDAPIPRRPAGVLFDLADTLAETRRNAYEESKANLAARLGVDPDLFMEPWVRSRRQASIDSTLTTRDRIEMVARDLGIEVGAETLDELAEQERSLWESSVQLKPGARDLLDRLGAAGTKVAIVSNGNSAMQGLPDSLGLTPLVSATVMSSVVGMLKPDPGIYERALADLGLAAADCVYIGDGSDRELEGAQEVGLFAVRMLFGAKPAYQTKHSLNWDATAHSFEELAAGLGV